MEQARLIQRLKERDGIKQGSRTDLTSDKLSEVVRQAGVSSQFGKIYPINPSRWYCAPLSRGRAGLFVDGRAKKNTKEAL